jgi:ABC-type antimicrobial peptide transport system permease subunit
MLVAAGTGVLAGLVPAWRAARLSVLDALRR